MMLVVFLGFSFTTANALLISVDPDAFVHGTNIENAFPDVTMDMPINPYWNNHTVYSVNSPYATTGSRGFGWYSTQHGDFNDWWSPAFGGTYLRADFHEATNYVDISGRYRSSTYNSGIIMDAYSYTSGFLGQATAYGSGIQTASYSSASWNIDYVMIHRSGELWSTGGSLDNLRYASAIPEPTTMLLLGTGLLGLAGARRRMKK